MSPVRTPRQAWIDQGLAALAAGGPDAVRIESLARALHVTKGGFYGYFADRAELLRDMLDAWERASTTEAVARAEDEGGDALTRAQRAADLTFAPELRPIDMAVREWARRDAEVADRLARVDGERMEYLRAHFRAVFPDPIDLEARCLLAFSAAIASDLIVAAHPGCSREVVLEHAARLLFTPATPPDARA